MSGWQAELQMGLQRWGAKSWLTTRHHTGPLLVQRPLYPEGGRCHLYLLHPPSGVVGGDQLTIKLHLQPQSQALLTTPGAMQFYRSSGATAEIHQQIHLEPHAELEWLPQESIYFNGCRVELENTIDLDANSRFISLELHTLGRAASGERFESGSIDLKLSLNRNQQPLLRERQRWSAEASAAGLRQQPTFGTLLATPMSRADLEQVRITLHDQPNFSSTLMDDLLIVRYLGAETRIARTQLRQIWQQLRPTLLGCAAPLPRIWAT